MAKYRYPHLHLSFEHSFNSGMGWLIECWKQRGINGDSSFLWPQTSLADIILKEMRCLSSADYVQRRLQVCGLQEVVTLDTNTLRLY